MKLFHAYQPAKKPGKCAQTVFPTLSIAQFTHVHAHSWKLFEGYENVKAMRQTDRQTDRQTYRQTDGQTDRQTDR